VSEQEFETYLKLLGRLLRLSESQREEIAEEFRAHFDQRVEELVDQGQNSETAIRAALRDFGDASALAQELTRISRQRKRRLIMKTSIGSVAACAAIGFFAPQLLPVAALQQNEDRGAEQQVAEKEADNESATTEVAAEEGPDNLWKETFNDGEIEVIDIAQETDWVDDEVSRRRAAEIAETIQNVHPFNEQIRASGADGLLIIFGSETARLLARDMVDRMVEKWRDRDLDRRVDRETAAEERFDRLGRYRDQLEQRLQQEYEELQEAARIVQESRDEGKQNVSVTYEATKSVIQNRIDALQASIMQINRELVASGMDD